MCIYLVFLFVVPCGASVICRVQRNSCRCCPLNLLLASFFASFIGSSALFNIVIWDARANSYYAHRCVLIVLWLSCTSEVLIHVVRLGDVSWLLTMLFLFLLVWHIWYNESSLTTGLFLLWLLLSEDGKSCFVYLRCVFVCWVCVWCLSYVICRV